MKGLNNRFPHRIRIFDGECSALARASHYRAQKGRLMTNESDTYAQAEPGKAPGSTFERKEMSFKTLRKRIALVAVAALAVTGLSTVTANAAGTAETITCTTAYNTSSCTQVIGGTAVVTFKASDDTIRYTITSSGVGNIGAATLSDDGNNYLVGTTTAATFPTTGLDFLAGEDNETAALTVTSAVAGTQTLTIVKKNASGTPTATYTQSITWTTASNTGISAAKSTMYVASDDGNCSDPGSSKAADDVIAAAERISRTGVNTAVDVCVIARDANENLLTIGAATLVSSTFGRSATTPANETGEYRLDLAGANALLSGTETLTAVVIDGFGNAAILTTTLSVYGSLKKIELSAARGSAYAAADQSTTDIDTFAEFAAATGTDRVLVVGIKATDSNNATIDLNAAGVAAANSITTSNWTVDSDKIAGTPADRTSQTLGSTINDLAPENELSSSRYGSFNVQYIVCGTKPEKLTLTAWGKDSDGVWIKSNSLDVYCSGAADKVEVTAAGQAVNVKVSDANGYPVADGTSVTLAASNGSVVAPTSKTTAAGVFAVPATFIASSTAASSQVTAIVGSKSGTSAPVAGGGTSLESQISSIVAAIAKLQAAINKINKRLKR
jgi:hypothetical protein